MGAENTNLNQTNPDSCPVCGDSGTRRERKAKAIKREQKRDRDPLLGTIRSALRSGGVTAFGILLVGFAWGGYGALAAVIQSTSLTWSKLLALNQGATAQIYLGATILGVGALAYGIGYQTGHFQKLEESDDE